MSHGPVVAAIDVPVPVRAPATSAPTAAVARAVLRRRSLTVEPLPVRGVLFTGGPSQGTPARSGRSDRCAGPLVVGAGVRVHRHHVLPMAALPVPSGAVRTFDSGGHQQPATADPE